MKKDNPKDIGDHSEAMILARFLRLRWVVLKPFGDNQRYDFVVDRGNGFERIQVKTGKQKEGVISFRTSSKHGRTNKDRHYRGECDQFAVYCPQNDGHYMIPVDEAPITEMTLRVSPPRNNQKKNMTLAKDFELPTSSLDRAENICDKNSAAG